MRIDNKVFDYIEYELRHFKEYEKNLKELELDIIDGNPPPADGQPKGQGKKSSPTEQKAIKIMTNNVMLRMRKTVDAIKLVYEGLDREHQRFFDLNYIERAGAVKIYTETSLEEWTQRRWRKKIVYAVGRELGIL